MSRPEALPATLIFGFYSRRYCWHHHAATAAPAQHVYQLNGKQYIVIAAGGHAKLSEESLSDALVAFVLP